MSLKLGELFYELGIEDQTKRDLATAKRNLEAWERRDGRVRLGLDDTELRKGVDKAGSRIDDFRGAAETPIGLEVDASGVRTGVDRAEGLIEDLHDLGAEPIRPTIDVDRIDDGAQRGRGSLIDMIGGWTTAAAAAAALGGAAVADKLIEGFNGVIEANRENDRLAASLGLSDDEATVAGRLAGDLWVDAFGESTGQVNDAVRAALLAIQPEMVQAEDGSMVPVTFYDAGSAPGLGETSDLVRTIAEDALNLASIFDVDVGEAIARASMLVRTGLASDMPEAFDLLFTGLQRIPAELQGTFMDSIDEYAKLIAPLGLSGEEMFALMVEGAKRGDMALDKTGDALFELTNLASDMSTKTTTAYDRIGLDGNAMADKMLAGGATAREGLDQIVDGLLAIEDPSDRAQTAVDLFGTPLEDLGRGNIPDFLRSLDNMSQGLGDFEGNARRTGRNLNDNLATDIDEIMRKLSPASLMQAFDQGGIEGLKARVQEAQAKIVAVWAEYGPAVKELLRDGLKELGELWDEEGPELIASLADWWSRTGAPATGDVLKGALWAAWEVARTYLKDRVTDPDWWIGLVRDGIVGTFTEAMLPAGVQMAVAATEWVKSVPGLVADLAAGAWDGLLNEFESVINAIINAWNNLSFTIPSFDPFGDYGPSTPGGTFGVPQIDTISLGSTPHRTVLGGQHAPPEFAKGGFVDAPVGKPLLAILHGGEYVNTADEVTRARRGAGAGMGGSTRRKPNIGTVNVFTNATTNRGTVDAMDRRLMGWEG